MVPQQFFGIRFLALAALLALGVGLWTQRARFRPERSFPTPYPQPHILPTRPTPTPEPPPSPTPTATPGPTPVPSPTPTPPPTPTPTPTPDPPPPTINLYRIPKPERTAVFAQPPMPVLLDLYQPPITELVTLPLASRFDFPLGTEHAGLVYNAQPFGKRGHLGDDWNGLGGYNTDFGDPVYVIGTGRVIMAAWLGGDWGNVVVVQHAIVENGERKYVQSLYAHMAEIETRVGKIVRRGQKIGTVGNADGRFYAHLHLEIRTFGTLFIGGGYRARKEGWVSPTLFLQTFRGAAPDDFSRELPIIPSLR